MSAEAFFRQLGSGLGDVYGEESQNARQKAQLDAEGQMQQARLLEEDNLARFHEQSDDARNSRTLQTEKDLASLNQAAEDRRQSAQLNQAQKQFEQTFGFQKSHTFDEDLQRAVDLAGQKKLGIQQQIAQNPNLQMQDQQLGALEQQLQGTNDPKQKQALTAQIQANGVYQLQEQADQENRRMILSVAKNPTDYAMIQVRVFGIEPTQAALAAKYRFQDKYTNLSSGAGSAGNTGAKPDASQDGGLVTQDMLHTMRNQALGPGSAPVAAPVLAPSTQDIGAPLQPVQAPTPQSPTSPAGRFGIRPQTPDPNGGIPGMVGRAMDQVGNGPIQPANLPGRFGNNPDGNDLIPAGQ